MSSADWVICVSMLIFVACVSGTAGYRLYPYLEPPEPTAGSCDDRPAARSAGFSHSPADLRDGPGFTGAGAISSGQPSWPDAETPWRASDSMLPEPEWDDTPGHLAELAAPYYGDRHAESHRDGELYSQRLTAGVTPVMSPGGVPTPIFDQLATEYAVADRPPPLPPPNPPLGDRAAAGEPEPPAPASDLLTQRTADQAGAGACCVRCERIDGGPCGGCYCHEPAPDPLFDALDDDGAFALIAFEFRHLFVLAAENFKLTPWRKPQLPDWGRNAA